MRIILSPAKSLDFASPIAPDVAALAVTQPRFLADSAALIDCLKPLSPAALSQLMKISDALALLNVRRYQAWQLPFTGDNARAALFTFHGEVYAGLNALTLSADDTRFAQEQLHILSGLYGVLRPLDLIQAYRLEMGIPLNNPCGRHLYDFWGDKPTRVLNESLAADDCPCLLNLASEEYSRVLHWPQIQAPVIQPVFEDWKNGRYKIITMYAKRARGLMTRYAIDHRVRDAEELKNFAVDGYAFEPAASDSRRWVFRRRR